MKHYHILCNIPGYMPDNDVEIACTKKAARESIRFHRDDYRDAGYVVRGKITDLDYMAYQDPDSAYDLGVHIYASACEDTDCTVDDDNES